MKFRVNIQFLFVGENSCILNEVTLWDFSCPVVVLNPDQSVISKQQEGQCTHINETIQDSQVFFKNSRLLQKKNKGDLTNMEKMIGSSSKTKSLKMQLPDPSRCATLPHQYCVCSPHYNIAVFLLYFIHNDPKAHLYWQNMLSTIFKASRENIDKKLATYSIHSQCTPLDKLLTVTCYTSIDRKLKPGKHI